MKLYMIALMAGLMMSMAACKKQSPVEELGATSGRLRAEVRVTLSNRRPALEETVRVTASSWHTEDRISKVEFLHTLIEKFGVKLQLDNTTFSTWSSTDPVMVVTDTIKKNEVWKSVSSVNKELDNYFVTATNNYVISGDYTLFKPVPGTYAMEGQELLMKLSEEAFSILRNQLSFVIAVADYQKLFPNAPAANYTTSGTTRTGISDAGRAYLRANLTRQLLVDTGFKSLKKEGTLRAILTVRTIVDSGAAAEVVNEFESTF
ncbi:hypothetical protein [Pedobacter sp. SYSU D00535]|uniref:hypothetical protein n=1 Tax=Pedobacter sp. SYSU D00535 TaxID=2810308 RepID=UPI001A979577|nr:hypothetical protein [Pedobacter sp. SYSU D00535]